MKRFLAGLSAFIIRLIAGSLRVTRLDHGEVMDRPDRAPVILAFWHNRLFLLAPFYQRYCPGRTALALISRSRDGQFISEVAARFGIKSARGSSSRHGMSAALTAIRAADDKKLDIVISPDGPRGPRGQVQHGILRLAQATGRPIVPITTQVRWKWVMKSWDRFQVPIPFSRCELISGEPMTIPENATEQELTSLAGLLADSLGGD